MSKSSVRAKKQCKVYNFKYLLLNEKSKEKNVTNSHDSTHPTSINKNLFKQISLPNNNNNNNQNIIGRNHSSINITKIKNYSKFKINKNENNEKKRKKFLGKSSTSKLLVIFKNSERSKNKVTKKESITDTYKKTDVESEPKKKTRFDNFGNLIDKKNKKNVHIAFIDQLMNGRSITEKIQIQSFKHYNYVKGLPKKDEYNPTNNFHKCCFIF